MFIEIVKYIRMMYKCMLVPRPITLIITFIRDNAMMLWTSSVFLFTCDNARFMSKRIIFFLTASCVIHPKSINTRNLLTFTNDKHRLVQEYLLSYFNSWGVTGAVETIVDLYAIFPPPCQPDHFRTVVDPPRNMSESSRLFENVLNCFLMALNSFQTVFEAINRLVFIVILKCQMLSNLKV